MNREIGSPFLLDFLNEIMLATPLEEKIADIVRPAVNDLGYALYMVRVAGEDRGKIVQIMAENPETGLLGIDDCTKISRSVSMLMDVEDPISGAYTLEVSSPGIDRYLVEKRHFEAYKGFEVKIETKEPNDMGQKRFRGRIRNVNEGAVILDTQQGDVEISLESMHKAKLVLSDELIKATAKD